MTKLFTALLGRIRTVEAITERARPPRRGFEITPHPAMLRRAEERPQIGSRAPRYR